MHTDHHKAKYILWYCHKQTTQGGESILVDANSVYTQMTTEERQQLKKIHLYEHKIFDTDRNSNPLVMEDHGGRKFYYSFWLTRDENRQNPALLKF